MLETLKVDNNKICKALFVDLRPLYVTDMRYLGECSGSGCVILSSVVNKYTDKRYVTSRLGISSPDELFYTELSLVSVT